MKPLASAAFFCLLLTVLGVSNATAALVATITGTIEAGTLNGNSISGQGFVLTTELVDGTDLYLSDDTIGFFAVVQATMQFESSDAFTFDPMNTYFGQSYRAPGTLDPGDGGVFNVGIVNAIPPAPLAQLGYQSGGSAIPPFDPNTFVPLAFSDFTSAFSHFSGPGGGPATFHNGANSLSVSGLSLAGASITAVPEPSSLVAMVSLGLLLSIYRRSRRSAQPLKFLAAMGIICRDDQPRFRTVPRLRSDRRGRLRDGTNGGRDL